MTHIRHITTGMLHNIAGDVVEPWDVRPDMMVLVASLADIVPSATTSIDGVSSYYVARVTCRISGDQVALDLEPGASDSLDAMLARLGG
jgi:hypothetical protein